MDDELEGSQDARIASLWSSLDTQGDGQLDAQGLRKGLKKIDHPLKNADNLLDQVIKAVDTNHDGRIEYTEFCDFIKHAETQLWVLFKSIDVDHNNQLSREEIRDAFKSAGIVLPSSKLEEFFNKIDVNHDGVISFDEWRDFLLFIPAQDPGLRTIFSYYASSVKLNAEGDVVVSDETRQGLGIASNFLSIFFGVFSVILAPPIRHRPPDAPYTPHKDMSEEVAVEAAQDGAGKDQMQLEAATESSEDVPNHEERHWKAQLTAFLPKPGYFLAGGISGIVSRTSTAPLDRLKVYLIAQTDTSSKAIEAVKKGSAIQATKHAARPLVDACKELWKAGGIRSLFAGNGLNVAKVMPESAIKFGSYEFSKRTIAQIEGHGDPNKIHPVSKFIAGGMGGIISQFFVYPIDTLKFRMQCEVVQGGEQGNKLIATTFHKMWAQGGWRPFYRGLSMGLVGMFPYAAIDLGTFEILKRALTNRNMTKYGYSEEDATPGSIPIAMIGGFSGAVGASLVYPINVLRTRLQTQGTTFHKRTYTGVADAWRQTVSQEGYRGLFRGLTPNLLKVVPAVSITYVVYENSKKLLNLH